MINKRVVFRERAAGIFFNPVTQATPRSAALFFDLSLRKTDSRHRFNFNLQFHLATETNLLRTFM
jgi:hypothetical protein